MGDSGGPMYLMQGRTPKCLYGVNSATYNTPGKQCDGGSMFSSVPYFLDWIKGEM